jgi:hypothetical protein
MPTETSRLCFLRARCRCTLEKAVLGKHAGYEDTNVADRFRVDTGMRHVARSAHGTRKFG